MDGITAAREIRTQFDNTCVFLNAFTGEESQAQAQLTNPAGYLANPFASKLPLPPSRSLASCLSTNISTSSRRGEGVSTIWSFNAVEINTQESLMSDNAFAMAFDSLLGDWGSML